ncbi:MFS transporter [Nonomuraea sp. NPDC050404]|uniref:MFS transporter n=1 Tax=Nonomuraea sp. NPDC050404 TaxID=3155783 RepID=UPI0033D1D2BF
MPAGVLFRLARATAFAVVCSGLAALAHLLGGGSVTAPTAATALVVSSAAAFPVTGRERGTSAVFFLLAAVQVVLHLMFSLAPSLPGMTGGHLHSGLVPATGMLAAHGLATVMTALWLSRGEAVLWALLRLLGVRVLLLLRAPHRTAYRRMAVRHAEPAPALSALLRHSLSGRAPPAA